MRRRPDKQYTFVDDSWSSVFLLILALLAALALLCLIGGRG